MKKKFKLFATIASISMTLALMVFGVIAATSVNVTINSNVSYTAEGVAFKLYGKSELMASQPVGDATDLTEGVGSANPADTVITVGVTNAGTDSMTLPEQTFTTSNTWVVYTFTVENIGSNVIDAITVSATASDENVLASADTPAGNLSAGQKETFRCYFHLENANRSISQNGTSVVLEIGESTQTNEASIAPKSLKGFTAVTEGNTTTWTKGEEVFSMTTSTSGTTVNETNTFSYMGRTTTFETNYDTSTVQAVASQAFSNTLFSTYVVADRTLTSCWVSGGSTEVIIPDWLNIVKTEGVYEDQSSSYSEPYYVYTPAFENEITSVRLPNTIVEIGEYTFLDRIDNYSYYDTDSLLEYIFIPEGVTTIGISAFENCSSLISVTIPATVTKIEDNAFEDCTELVSVSFTAESQLESIGDSAFYYCNSLSTIGSMPNLVSVGERAFFNCPSLVNTYENGEYLKTENNQYKVLLDLVNDNVTSFTFHASCEVVGNSAFYNSDITSINFPAGLKGISPRSFYRCGQLTSITIPASVTNIGDGAFTDCYALAEVYNLSDLNITAGDSSNGSVGYYANVIHASALEASRIVESNGMKYYTYADEKIALIPVDNASGTSITLDNDTTEINQRAFYVCSTLTSIEIPATVTNIGSYAFYDCANLAQVTFGSGSQLESIGERSFNDCVSLSSIGIPASVTSIGSAAFLGCTDLASVTFGADSQLENIGSSAFNGCSLLSTIEIPAGVTSIESQTFYDCGFDSISFAEGSQLKSIGDSAFAYSSLTSIEIPDGVTDIERNAFRFCGALSSVVIPASVTSIGPYAFYNTGISSVIFEDPTGWWRTSDSSATSGTEISTSITSSPSSAARYLDIRQGSTSYYNYYWKKS